MATALVSSKGTVRFSRSTLLHCSSLMKATGASSRIPAQQTSTSIRPKTSSTCCTNFAEAQTARVRLEKAHDAQPDALLLNCNAAAPHWHDIAKPDRIPQAPVFRAAARPIPPLAPVTRTPAVQTSATKQHPVLQQFFPGLRLYLNILR